MSKKVVPGSIKFDITGIILIILGFIFIIMAFISPNGAITGPLSLIMHVVFGIGVYIFPIILITIGVLCFVKSDKFVISKRFTIGSCLILLSTLVILAICTNHAEEDPGKYLFISNNLFTHGGYVGAGIAWMLLVLLGKTIGIIVLIGVMLVGFVFLGLSLNKFFIKYKAKLQEKADIQAKVPTSMTSEQFVKSNASEMEDRMAPTPTRILDPNLHVSQSDKTSIESFNNKADKFIDSEEQVMPTILLKRDKKEKNEPDDGFQDAPTVIIDSGNKTNFVEPEILSDKESANLKAEQKLRQESENIVVDDILDEPNMHEVTDNLRNIKNLKINIETSKKENNSDSIMNAKDIVNDISDTFKDVVDINSIKSSATTNNNAANTSATSVSEINSKVKTKTNSSSTIKTASLQDKNIIYELPSLSILSKSKNVENASHNELKHTAINLENTIQEFGIAAKVVNWIAGPTVTLFSIDIPAGCRVNKITNLTDDIALALASPGVRIFAPVPGTNYVGIEVPNKKRQTVYLGDILPYIQSEESLEIAIGKDVEGNHVISDLSKMPHLLIGGTTGSGKSVSINAMIMSIIMRATPRQVRMILIDPKRVEFSLYDGIPHLYVPVVTEPKEAASALSWAVAEMERRLKVFKKEKVRNIKQYNQRVVDGLITEDGSLEGSSEIFTENTPRTLPYIVIIIDELADLMMNAGREVEFSISRIAAVARAAGIHLIIATQRPSANVVTGLIKSNITNRIAFNVASSIDSRVILDSPGAENLIGLGDLLFSKTEIAKPVRIQGCFVSENEIYDVVNHLCKQAKPDYHDEILKTSLIDVGRTKDNASSSVGSSNSDEDLFWQAAEIVCSSGVGSTSAIQRKLKLGYARAGRIMDMLEEKGIVGPPQGSKPREVLLDELELESLKAIEEHMSDE